MDDKKSNLHKSDMKPVPHVRWVGRFYCARDWSWDPQALPSYNLWTVLQGRGFIENTEHHYDFSGGDCFILNHGCSYRARHDPDDPITVVAVHFDYLDASGRFIYPAPPQEHRRLDDLQFMVHLLERLENSRDRGGDSNVWLRACLAETERQDEAGHLHGYSRKQSIEIDALCQRIRQNPGHDWKVEQMAAQMCCSRAHFSRLFRQFTGVTPREFISTIRIETAKGLLHSSNYTVEQLGRVLGYRDIYYFSRHFKLKTGLSPTAYRNAGG